MRNNELIFYKRMVRLNRFLLLTDLIRNMGQCNFYLILTVQTNYLTVCQIWCLKSAKNFIKNNSFIVKYKIKKEIKHDIFKGEI